jgi:heme a synthase
VPTDPQDVHTDVQRLTVAVAVIALLPIGMGSLVTTLGAGMAFLDWPSSDGQNMLLYPWLSDFRAHPDKFIEHGHRLAGMLIGFMSIALVVVTWIREPQRWVRRTAVVVLIAVIAQGLLGGLRVRLDRQVLAMIHSITAALFFCLCFVFALACRNRWRSVLTVRQGGLSPMSLAATCSLPLVVLAQYTLGGAFRHLHTMLYEHIAGAIITAILAVITAFGLLRSGNPALVRLARTVVAVLMLQICLGLAAYVTRLGFQSTGYVATMGSLSQSIFCSAHTIGGMLLLNASVLSAITTARLLRHGSLQLVHADASLPLPATGKGHHS